MSSSEPTVCSRSQDSGDDSDDGGGGCERSGFLLSLALSVCHRKRLFDHRLSPLSTGCACGTRPEGDEAGRRIYADALDGGTGMMISRR